MRQYIKARLASTLSRGMVWSEELRDNAPALRAGHQIGRHTYGRLTIRGDDSKRTLSVGAFCSIAAGATVFLGGEHRMDWVSTYPFNVLWDGFEHHEGHPRSRGDVVIGNDVWLGTQCMIMSGVTIGDGAVVGARAVVRRDVPPYAVVSGDPAEIRKFRFDPPTVERLLSVRWWEWPDADIASSMPLFLSDQTEAFLDFANKRV